MSPISQPGSDYQLSRLTLDAGNARDIMLLLADVHAVLDRAWRQRWHQRGGRV